MFVFTKDRKILTESNIIYLLRQWAVVKVAKINTFRFYSFISLTYLSSTLLIEPMKNVYIRYCSQLIHTLKQSDGTPFLLLKKTLLPWLFIFAIRNAKVTVIINSLDKPFVMRSIRCPFLHPNMVAKVTANISDCHDDKDIDSSVE